MHCCAALSVKWPLNDVTAAPVHTKTSRHSVHCELLDPARQSSALHSTIGDTSTAITEWIITLLHCYVPTAPYKCDNVCFYAALNGFVVANKVIDRRQKSSKIQHLQGGVSTGQKVPHFPQMWTNLKNSFNKALRSIAATLQQLNY